MKLPFVRCLAILVPLLVCLGPAHAATRTVCASGAQYTTISAAIGAAAAGDTISICPGTYSGTISVNKANLIFQSNTGERNDVTLTSSGGTVQITAQGITLRNMRVVSTGGTAISVGWGGNGSHTFDNLIVNSHDNAIKAEAGSTHIFRNLVVTSAIGNGIETTYNAPGAHVLTNIDVTADREAIKLDNGGPYVLTNVLARSNNAKGIEFTSNANGSHVFDRVTVRSRTNGIEVGRAATMRFVDVNVISQGAIGILTAYNAPGAHTFENMTIQSQGNGIEIGNGGGMSFKNLNIASSAGEGLRIAGVLTATNTFEDLIINAYNTALHIAHGGKQALKNIDATSRNGVGVHLTSNADGQHTFENIKVHAEREGLHSVRGAVLMRDIEAYSNAAEGVRIGNKYAAEIENVRADAHTHAFYIVAQESGVFREFRLTNLDLVSRAAEGLNVARSGKLTINNLKVKAAQNAVQLAFDSNGPHEIRNVQAESTGGIGLNIMRGVKDLEDIIVVSQGHGMNISNEYNVNITGASVTAHNATAINFNNNSGVGASYSIKNVTVESAGGANSDGLYFHTATNTPQVRIDNICVRSAGRHGINYHWNSNNTQVINSIIRGQGGVGINLTSNPAHSHSVTNSCFYNAPCAYSASTSYNFSGNYWGPGVAACNNVNVNASSPLASCPIRENECYSGTIGPAPVPTPGGFNAFETTTAANAITGVIKTKVSGLPINLAVVAVNEAKDGVHTAFVGDVKIELIGNTTLGVALDTSNQCPLTSTTLDESSISASFVATDAGRKNVTFPAPHDAWRDVRVRMSYPATGTPTVVSCSTDNFAIRPAALANLQALDANWEAAGTARALNNEVIHGGVVHKAGRPFTLRVNAVNGAGTPAITSNYKGSPTVRSLACVLPVSGCINGTLNGLNWSESGTFRASTASYSEAGVISLLLEDASFASVDDKPGDSSVSERTIAQAEAATIGRFVPDHFTLEQVGDAPRFRTFDAECSASRSFTYVGQPFGFNDVPQAVLKARNAVGGITRNYSGNLWKLTFRQELSDAEEGALDTSAAVAPDLLVSTTPANRGTADVTASSATRLRYIRDEDTPAAPFQAHIVMRWSAQDESEAGVTGQGITATELAFNGIAFDAGSEMRYGRLQVGNAHGSDGFNLTVPINTQYWNGTKFVNNAADHCTTLAPAAFNIINHAHLTAVNLPGSRVFSVSVMQSGSARVTVNPPLSRPVRGSADLCADLDAAGDVRDTTCAATTPAAKPWLQGARTQSKYIEDPRGKINFGVSRSGPVLYMREVY